MSYVTSICCCNSEAALHGHLGLVERPCGLVAVGTPKRMHDFRI